MSEVDTMYILERRKQELEQQISDWMREIKPLKQELEQVTKAIYTHHCQEARQLPVWELQVNTGKTVQEAKSGELITICEGVTWEQMYNSAAKYFEESQITGWTIQENNPHKDCGQFHYVDGYNGGPILGRFGIMGGLPKIIYAFDLEATP